MNFFRQTLTKDQMTCVTEKYDACDTSKTILFYGNIFVHKGQ